MDVRVGLWRKLSTEELMLWTVVLEKTFQSPLDSKEIQPVHSKGDQPWVYFGRNDAKAETLVLWPPHAKSWLIGKDSDAGRDWGQGEKRATEDEMAGWHHWLDGREFEWTLGDGDGQGGLACCDSWSCKESDTTEWLNWTELSNYRSSAHPEQQEWHCQAPFPWTTLTSRLPQLWTVSVSMCALSHFVLCIINKMCSSHYAILVYELFHRNTLLWESWGKSL